MTIDVVGVEVYARRGHADLTWSYDGRRVDVTVRAAGTEPAQLDRVEIALDLQPSRVLEHGHQSWSVVRRTTADDVRPERAGIPDWARGCHVSAPDRAGHVVAGDQFLVTDEGVVGFLDARSHLGVVEARRSGVVAVALLDGVELAPGAERALDPLWVADGDPGALYSAYAREWGRVAGARVGRGRGGSEREALAPTTGWCSWYQYFAGVTPGDVRANLRLAAAHGIDLVQVDDGYQSAVGDWLTTSDAWREGTEALAGEIRAAGVRAGIWTAPFLAGAGSALLAAHPDWLSAHSSGHPSKAAYNPGSWGGFAYALDTTRDDVLDHLRSTFAALTAQGFDYHKIDFCYAAALPATRRDPTKTRAEALRLGLDAVREGIGDDAFLLGCGCPFGPAVGVVDAMRVSADVAPVWQPEASWPGFAETAPSARNAIAASVLRAPLHRRVFLNDPDCLLLRPTDTGLDARQRQVLSDAVAGSGAFLVLSDDLDRYGDAEWRAADGIRAAQSRLDVELDIADPFADPVVVGAADGSWSLTIDWDAPTSSFEPGLAALGGR
ncbi:MAG TPA: glycoside hydrolase family 36 protein [Acidimicrobiales bacterium]